jgi:hypothetical protein
MATQKFAHSLTGTSANTRTKSNNVFLNCHNIFCNSGVNVEAKNQRIGINTKTEAFFG